MRTPENFLEDWKEVGFGRKRKEGKKRRREGKGNVYTGDTEYCEEYQHYTLGNC